MNTNTDLAGGSPSSEGQAARVGKLDTLAGVRNEMARLYRVARKNAGKAVDAPTAAKLAYLLNCIGRSLEATELEKRIAAIEEHLRSRKQ